MRERLRRQARAIYVTLLLGVGGGAVPAGAAERGSESDPAGGVPGAATISGGSTCPQPENVWAELASLLPPERLGEKVRAAGPLEIADLGASFRVTAAGRVREYKDEGRDCMHRARVAAVFVALTLAPASLAEPRPAPPSLPPPPPPPSPPPAAEPVAAAVTAAAPAEQPPPAARIDVGAALDVGLGPDGSVTHASAALRVAVGRGRVALAAGTAVVVPVETTVSGVRLRQWRLPLDAGVRVRFAPAGIAPYAELGLCAALLSERALDLETARGQTGVELGVRAALGAHLPTLTRLAPFAALQAELVPRPLTIFALPRGDLGSTPLVWIGATVGGSLGFP